jgi:uncharacterized protein YkuJ
MFVECATKQIKYKGVYNMKNTVEWQDIVKIGDEYYLECFEVEFEDERLNEIKFGKDERSIINKLKELENDLADFDFEDDPLYSCSNFFLAIGEKYNLTEDELDDVETYMFDDIDLPDEVCEKYDIAWLGGYINGVNI